MASKVAVVDCETGDTTTRNATAAEQAVIDADRQAGGAMFQAQTAKAAREQDAGDALTQLIAQAGGVNVRAKLKAVLAGTDQFTPAQRDRLLAAVALYVLRDRSDS